MAVGVGAVPRLVGLQQVRFSAAHSPRPATTMTTLVIITPPTSTWVRTQAQSPTASNTTAHTIQPQVYISAMTAADVRARNVGASDRNALSATAALNVRPLPLAGVSSIKNTRAPVAQLDRALPSEGKGRTFESSRARQLPADLSGVFGHLRFPSQLEISTGHKLVTAGFRNGEHSETPGQIPGPNPPPWNAPSLTVVPPAQQCQSLGTADGGPGRQA